MGAVRLHSVTWGDGEGLPLVVLHGLLGSSRNWATVGKALGADRRVVGLDLRNHGASGGGAVSSLSELVDDVRHTLAHLELPRVALLGHSLGGKVAMRLACEGALVERLVVVDIAPRAYASGSAEVEAMRALDVAALRSRKDAAEALAVPDRAHRQFLLTNLERTDDGQGFRWRVDLDALAASLGPLRGAPLAEGARYEGPTLWAVGGASRYIEDGDEALMRRHFPSLEVARFEGAGHNVHVDARDALVERLRAFLG